MARNAGVGNDKPLVRQESLVDQVFEILYERIINGQYPPGSQLPTVSQLSKEFRVSRSTIRFVMSRLEDRKLVYRRQGVGTYVREVVKIPNPLNEFIEFSQLIKAQGYRPGSRTVSSIVEPDDEILKLLQLPAGSQVLEQRKIFTADDDPIIFAVNHIPVWVFEDVISCDEALKPNLTDKFLDFFEIICKQELSHFVSTVRADIYENINPPSVLINAGPDTPVLVINETGFNKNDRPIVNSCEFHPGNWMEFQMIRRLGAKINVPSLPQKDDSG